MQILPPACKQYVEQIVAVCSKRISHMTKAELYQAADVVYLLGYTDTFLKHFLLNIETRLQEDKPSASELLQIMFYISALRSAPVTLMSTLEELLLLNIDLYNAKEISLICHAFFSSNFRIKNFLLIDAIAKKSLPSMNDLDMYLISNVLKVLKHSGYDDRGFYEQLALVLTAHKIPKEQSLINLCHVCQAYCHARHRDSKLLDCIAKAVLRIIGIRKPVREKDLTRIIWTFACFNYRPPAKLLQLAEVQWQQKTRTAYQFPEVFVEFLVAMAVMGQYPKKLFDVVFSPAFIKRQQGT